MALSLTVKLVIFAFFALLLFAANFSKPKKYLFLVGFIMPLAAININVGINLFWHFIIGPVSLLIMYICPARRRRMATIPVIGGFFIYVVAVTVIWMLFEYGMLHRYELIRRMGMGAGQSIYRMPIQLLSFFFQASALFIIPTRARTIEEVQAAFKGYGFGLVFSAIAGIVMYIFTGSGMISSSVNTVIINVGGTTLSRIGGLSLEPRHLGAFTVVFLGFALASGVLKSKRISIRELIPIILCFGILFVTFSTSSWVATAVSLSVFLVLVAPRFRSAKIKLAILSLGLFLGLAVSTSFAQSAFKGRVVDRILADEGEKRDIEGEKDYYSVEVFSDNPRHLVFGFGFGGFDLEAFPYLLRRPFIISLHMPTPTSTGVQLLTSLGIVGCLFFAFVIFRWFRYLSKRGSFDMAAALLISASGLAFVSGMALAAFMFLAGGALTVGRIREDVIRSRHQS